MSVPRAVSVKKKVRTPQQMAKFASKGLALADLKAWGWHDTAEITVSYGGKTHRITGYPTVNLDTGAIMFHFGTGQQTLDFGLGLRTAQGDPLLQTFNGNLNTRGAIEGEQLDAIRAKYGMAPRVIEGAAEPTDEELDAGESV